MQQHLTHCDLLNIPYSNCIRADSKPKRMCGIHIVKPREWFKAMRPIIDKYRPMLKAGEIKLSSIGFNEILLLRMIIESNLGEPPPNLSPTYWSSMVTSHHHGIHLQLAQHSIDKFKKSKGYTKRKSEFLAACRTDLFNELRIQSPKIGSVLNSIAKSYDPKGAIK
jgi:hypothetical protein